MAKLWALAKSWPHERDQGYYMTKTACVKLWDCGCHDLCHRCQLEKLLAQLEKESS